MASATATAVTASITTERDDLRAAAKAAMQRIDGGQGNSADIKALLQHSALLTQVLAEIAALGL